MTTSLPATQDAPSELTPAGRRAPVDGALKRLGEVPTALLIALLAVFAVVHINAYPGRFNSDEIFNSPHENARYVLAQQWLDTGRPTYELPDADELPQDISAALTPRDAGRIGDEVVPKDFAYSVALVTGLLVIDERLPFFLTTISAVALLIVTWFLALRALESRRKALLATVLFGVTTAFWSAGSGLVETGATTAALYLGGVLALLHRRRLAIAEGAAYTGIGFDVIAGLCFAGAIGTHYAMALLVAGTGVAFAWPRDGGSPRRFFALAGAGAVALLPLLVFNNWIYGAPFTDGYSVGAEFLQESLGSNSGGLFSLRPSLLGEHIVRYGLRPEVLVVVALAVIGWWAGQRSHRPSVFATLGRAALIGGLPFMIFSGARPLTGVDTFLVNSSFSRYMAPVVALVAIAAAAGAAVVFRWRRAVAAVALVLAVGVAANTNYTSSQGVQNTRRSIPIRTERRDAILDYLPTDAFVINGRGDKTLWPVRKTVTAQFLVDTPPEPGDNTHVHQRYPTPERLADVITRLKLGGHEVYLWNDVGWFGQFDKTAYDRLDAALAEAGITRRAAGYEELWAFDV